FAAFDLQIDVVQRSEIAELLDDIVDFNGHNGAGRAAPLLSMKYWWAIACRSDQTSRHRKSALSGRPASRRNPSRSTASRSAENDPRISWRQLHRAGDRSCAQ